MQNNIIPCNSKNSWGPKTSTKEEETEALIHVLGPNICQGLGKANPSTGQTNNSIISAIHS